MFVFFCLFFVSCFYSISFKVFTVDEESTSDDSSFIEGDKAVESDDESESDEPIDKFEKLEYWAKRHVLHYQPRILPEHVLAAYLCSPHSEVIRCAYDRDNLDPED